MQRGPPAATRAWPGSTRSCARSLADELERLSDPRLGLVTITGVDVSADLRHATVYYSALDAERDEARGDGGSCRNSTPTSSGVRRRRRALAGSRGAAPARRARSPGAAEVRARAHVPRGSRDRGRASASRRSSASCTRDEHRRRGAPNDRTRGRRRALARAAQAIDGADTVALACHVNPDGDALGSMLGLFHVLRAAGRDVVASFPPPFVVAPHYRELPGLDLLTKPDDFPAEPDVMVTFDCGSLGRLGDLEPSAEGRARARSCSTTTSRTRATAPST